MEKRISLKTLWKINEISSRVSKLPPARISSSPDFVIRNFRSYTKSAIRIRNFVSGLDFVYEITISYIEISSQKPISYTKFRLWARIWLETKFRIRNFVSRANFVYEISLFRIRNFVSQNIPLANFRRGGGSRFKLSLMGSIY